MMKVANRLVGVAVGLALVGACGPNDLNGISEQDIASQWLNAAHDNSSQANGVALNGVRYNGVRYNGVRYNGVRYNGVRYNGTSLAGTPEDQSVEVDSAALTGFDLDGDLSDGSILAMQITSVQWNSLAAQYLYNIRYYSLDTYSWEWLCGTDEYSQPIAAIPIMKSYLYPTFDIDGDLSRFTFSCVNAALGKCALWGYAPWKTGFQETYNSSTKTRDLGPSHQACQRLVRADYCGDGTPHTRNGTPIDVYDTYSIQTPDNVGGNTLEADWRADGAHCIKHTRWGTADSTVTPGETDLQYVQRVCPSRLAANDASCSNDANSTFHQCKGFGLTDQSTRYVLRNQSYLH
ncbi:MAG: pentapeptide repeat-containing protein [Myxococcales bacterium]|nr:pentapeptide repeat-containing protein [Myxococcales bacterium]